MIEELKKIEDFINPMIRKSCGLTDTEYGILVALLHSFIEQKLEGRSTDRLLIPKKKLMQELGVTEFQIKAARVNLRLSGLIKYVTPSFTEQKGKRMPASYTLTPRFLEFVDLKTINEMVGDVTVALAPTLPIDDSKDEKPTKRVLMVKQSKGSDDPNDFDDFPF